MTLNVMDPICEEIKNIIEIPKSQPLVQLLLNIRCFLNIYCHFPMGLLIGQGW